jgi:hypothetical protein
MYKKGVVQPLLECISQTKGRELLQEIHSGICGSHIGPRALSAKALRQGFYWPTHIKDGEEIVKTYTACQTFSPLQSGPSAPTQLISPSWSLQRWRMDLVGPLPTAQGGTNRCRRYRILHKMDRSETTGNHNLRNNQEIFLAKHSLQIWSPKIAHSRQREAVRFR